MRRRLLFLTLGFVLALGFSLILLTDVAPILAKRKLIAGIQQSCGGCELAVDRVRFIPPSEVVVEGIHYQSSRALPVQVAFEFYRLEGRVALAPLLHGMWEFSQVRAVKPTFQVLEKDPKPPRPSSPDRFPSDLPPLMISDLAISDGSFIYIHHAHAQDAVIHVSHIEGTARNFSSRPGLGSSATSLELSCRLERSGRCRIDAAFDLLAVRNDDRIAIDLRDQALSQLDPYFFQDDGVRLDGMLERATATMAIRRGILSGDLAARYRDLAVHYSPTADRGSTASFFDDTLQKLILRKTRERQPSPETHFQEARQRGQSVINFMLAGLKPAARKILTGRS